jgi:hypothetical protein
MGKMKNWTGRILVLLAALLFLAGATPAWGHSFSVTTSFSCLGSDCSQSSQHQDEAPWKGWAYLTVTNTGSESWGDFHFELFQVTDPIDNVFFDVASPNEPTSNRTSLNWAVSDGGHTLDLYFYNDPVGAGETLNINVYTNNATDNVSFFGTLYYPTPIPEPGTAALLGFALLGVLAAARRTAR